MAPTTGRMEAKLSLNWKQFKDELRGAKSEVSTFARSAGASFASVRNMLGLVGVSVSAGAMARWLRSTVSDLSALGKQARDTGLDVEELQGLMRGFERNTRVNSEQLSTALVDFNGRVGQAITGQGELAAVADRYGIALRGANGQVRSQSDLLREVARVIRSARTEQERLAIAQAAFGEPGRLMASALASGVGVLDDMVAQAREAGDVIDRNLIHRAEILDDKFDALTRRVGTFFQTLAVGVLAGGAETAQDTLERMFGTLERARSILGDGLFDTLIAETGELAQIDGVIERLEGLGFSAEEMGRSARWAEGQLAGLVFGLNELGQTAPAERIRTLYDELVTMIGGLNDGSIGADEFSARLVEISQEAVDLVSDLDDIDSARFTRVTTALGRMIEQLVAARRQAQGLRTDLPGAVVTQSESFWDTDESRFSLNRLAPATSPRPPPAPVLDSIGNRGGRGGRSGRELNDYVRATAAIREETSALEMEAAALAATAVAGMEYAQAIDYAQQRATLMNAAQQAGITITPALQAEIDGLARAYAEAGAAAERSADQLREVEEQAERGAERFVDFFGRMSKGGDDARRAVIDLIAELLRMRAIEGLSGLAKSGGGGFLGSVVRFLGFDKGGYTGDQPDSSVAGVVHGGEYVFSARAVRRLGIGALERMHQAATRGYRSGGYVGSVPASAATAASGGSAAATININIDGANGDQHVLDLVRQGVRQGLELYDRGLPDRVSQIQRNPRSR